MAAGSLYRVGISRETREILERISAARGFPMSVIADRIIQSYVRKSPELLEPVGDGLFVQAKEE